MALSSGSQMASGAADNGNDIDVNIKLVDIIDYVGDSVRPIREGSAVFEAQHIVCIGYRNRSSEYVDFVGYVRQSSHPNQVPHTVELKITEGIQNWILKCSCKAGTNRCKHIVACLLQLNRSGKAEYVTCTDAVQAWGISKVEKNVSWGAKPISDLCCVRSSKHVQPTDPDLKNNILAECFNRILNAAKGSAIQKHRDGRYLNPSFGYHSRALQIGTIIDDQFCSSNELQQMLSPNRFEVTVEYVPFETPQQELFYNSNIANDLLNILRVAEETQGQSTNYWKIQRALRITASSCYKLYTYLKNENPDWDKKIARYWSMATLKVRAVAYGTETEKLAFNCYRTKRNPLVKKCGMVIKLGECWFAASPDGVDPLNRLVVEIKCPLAGETGGIEELENNSAVRKYIHRSATGQLMLNKRHEYYCQVQMNMWVLQCEMCDFVVYSKKDDDFIVLEIPFDIFFVENVANGLKGLYFNLMLAKLLPEARM